MNLVCDPSSLPEEPCVHLYRFPKFGTTELELEEERLDGLNQTLPLSIVVVKLLVIPVFRGAGGANVRPGNGARPRFDLAAGASHYGVAAVLSGPG